MQTVAKLHEQGADIEVDGLQDLAVVVHLLGMLVIVFLALGDYIHQEGHIISETRPDILQREAGILHHIVKEGRNNGVGIQFQFLGGYIGDSYGMNYIGLAGIAFLTLMRDNCQRIGVLDAEQVLFRDPLRHHIEYMLCGKIYTVHSFHRSSTILCNGR